MATAAVQERRKATWSRAYVRTRDRVTASRRARRAAEVQRAALVASEDDGAFSVERVNRESRQLFVDVQDAWDRDDVASLESLVGPDLLTEWKLRLADFRRKGWRNHVTVRNATVEYVGMTNRLDETEDRVVVRVAALLEDVVVDAHENVINHQGNATGETHLREYWTLAKRNGGWTLQSIEQDMEGEYRLDEVLESDPSEDSRLTDRARVEVAVADALPSDIRHGDVADANLTSGDLAARDLSLSDQRFDPDVIEAAVRRGVEAWSEAIDGDDAAFARLAQPRLLEELLHPPGLTTNNRLVVRAPVVRRVAITGVDTTRDPPRATVDIDLEGVRYIEDRNTLALVGGTRDRPTAFGGTWTLVLDGPDDAPWRIETVRDDPARGEVR